MERSIISEYTKAWYKCSVSLRYLKQVVNLSCLYLNEKKISLKTQPWIFILFLFSGRERNIDPGRKVIKDSPFNQVDVQKL